MKTWEGKSWSEMSAEEREKIRTERRIEHGGAECNDCGVEDHDLNMVTAGGKVYCEDCAPVEKMTQAELNRDPFYRAGGGPCLTQAEADALDKQ